MNEAQETEQYAGIQFLPARTESTKGVGGYLGLSLHKPQFTNREQMAVAIEDLDSVDARKIALVNEQAGTADYIDGYKAIVSKITGKTYSIRSDRYTPVQDNMVARPCYDAAGELGLETAGSIHGVGTGRTSGYVLLSNQDAGQLGIEFGQGHNFADFAALGVEFINSYTGETSFGGRMFLLRRVCSNYAAMGTILGQFKKTHTGDLHNAEQGFKNMITDAIKRFPELIKTIEKAQEIPVITVDLPDLLWGIDDALPITAIDAICAAPQAYTPEMDPKNMTVWNIHNTITAWVSWQAAGTNNLAMVDRVSESANRLLTTGMDKLIEQGRERKLDYIMAAKQRQERKVEKQKAEAMAIQQARIVGDAF